VAVVRNQTLPVLQPVAPSSRTEAVTIEHDPGRDDRMNRDRNLVTTVVLLGVLAAALLSTAATAAEPWTPTYLPHLTTSAAAGPIVIDGLLDDPGWQGLPRAVNFAEHNPGDQVQPPVETEAMLTYDESYIYIAYICHDDPKLVRASLCERDNIYQDDNVVTALDTYGDQSWAYEIACNPLGIQGDILWSASYGEDTSYEMVFESAGKLTPQGWQVEMAIPLTSLRFPDKPEQTWRVDFWRNHPREVRGQYSWAAYDRDEQCWPCQWGTVDGLVGLKAGKGLAVLPALVASQSGTRDDQGWHNGKVTGDFGVSASWDLAGGVSAEGTYNPDFSQVESDAAQIDVNTTFALFYPERRPFFQEGSDLFYTYFNAVYTRSINNPLVAGKLIGRPGRTNVAYLVARDENTPYIVPFEERSELLLAGKSTSNILRLRQALGENSYVGMVGTDRRLDGGGAGSVLGVDTRARLGKNHQLEFQILRTFTEEPSDTTLSADFAQETFADGRHTAAFDGESYQGDALYASLERSGRSFSFDLDFWQRSPTFRADNGFEFRNDRREGIANFGYEWNRKDRFLDQLGLNAQLARVWNYDGQRKDEWLNLSLSPRFQWAQSSLHASWMVSNENFRDLQFDGIWQTHLCAQLTPVAWLNCGANYNYGHRIARNDLVLGVETLWGFWADLKPADRLQISTSFASARSVALDSRYAGGDLVVAEGKRLFSDFVTRTSTTLLVTRELSLRLIIQYDDFDAHWEADPLVTYQLNPFSVFYVGSTRDYGQIGAGPGTDQEWRLTDRQYFLKLQYLFGA
jgi:hypothetical protein